MPQLGLVTVLFKSDDVLEDFFKSISIQRFKDYKLYVIDNSAGPATINKLQECQEKYPITSIDYIDSGGNIGVAAANNIGIKKAIMDGCEDLLILNNDIVFSQEEMFEKMKKLSETEHMITPKILYFDSKNVWMAGGYMDYRRALGVHYGYDQKDQPSLNISKHVTYAPTCFLWVKATVFEKVGLMDESYFAYYDDTDFVLRCLRAGYSIWYEPSLSLLHKVSSSSGGDYSPFYIYYGNRNKLYFIRKHFTGLRKLWLLAYAFASRIGFYIKYNKAGRNKLVEAMRDGMHMPISTQH